MTGRILPPLNYARQFGFKGLSYFDRKKLIEAVETNDEKENEWVKDKKTGHEMGIRQEKRLLPNIVRLI